MPVSADLLSILACPSADHAPLRLETVADSEVLVCSVCLSRFPVRDGIPVLLADEAEVGPAGLGVPADTAPAAPDPARDLPTAGAASVDGA